MKQTLQLSLARLAASGIVAILWLVPAVAQTVGNSVTSNPTTSNSSPVLSTIASEPAQPSQPAREDSIVRQTTSGLPDSRIGPDDLLNITVFEAPELNVAVRVSASGDISMQLLGEVHAAGLTPSELEVLLQGLLRRNAELVGLKSNFTILDADDQLRLMKQLIDAADIEPAARTVAPCAFAILTSGG